MRKKSEKENEQLKCDLYNTAANLQHITIEYEKEIEELKAQIERISGTNFDVIKKQGKNRGKTGGIFPVFFFFFFFLKNF